MLSFPKITLTKLLAISGLVIILPFLVVMVQVSISAKESDKPPIPEPLPDFTSSLKFYDYHRWETDNNSNKMLDDWYPTDPGWGKTYFQPVAYIPNGYLSQMGVSNLSDAEIIAMMHTETQRVIDNSERLIPSSDYIAYNPVIVRSSYTLNQIICGTPAPCENPNWNLLSDAASRDYIASNDETPIFFLFGGGGIASGSPYAVFIGDCGWDELLGYSLPTNQCLGIDGLQRFHYTILHEVGHAIGVWWHSPDYVSHPDYSIMAKRSDSSATNIADHPGYPEKDIFCKSSYNRGLKLCSNFAQPSRPPITSTNLSGHVTADACQAFNTNYKVGLYYLDPYNYAAGANLLRYDSIDQNGAFTISLSGLNILGWQDYYRILISQSLPSQITSPFFDNEYYFNPNNNQVCESYEAGSNCTPVSNATFLNINACLTSNGQFPPGTNLYSSGVITCGTNGTTSLPNGRASAQVISPNASNISYTNNSSLYSLTATLNYYGPAYPYVMRFRQYYPGTLTVFTTDEVTFYMTSSGTITLNGQTIMPDEFHHNFSHCAASSTPTPTHTPPPTPTPSTPYPIQGSITCQSNPANMSGKTMYLRENGNIVAQNTVFYSGGGGGQVGAYGFNYAADFVNKQYSVRPAPGPESCGLWFCPNNGGTYECIHQRGGQLIAKRNADNCNDAGNPQVWCNENYTLPNCWMNVSATALSFTATCCGGSCTTPTPTATPTPPANCVNAQVTNFTVSPGISWPGIALVPSIGHNIPISFNYSSSGSIRPTLVDVSVYATDPYEPPIPNSPENQIILDRHTQNDPPWTNGNYSFNGSLWFRNQIIRSARLRLHYNSVVCGTNNNYLEVRTSNLNTPAVIPHGQSYAGGQTTCTVSGWARSEAADFTSYWRYVLGQQTTQQGVPLRVEIYADGPRGVGQRVLPVSGETEYASITTGSLIEKWGLYYANHGYERSLSNTIVDDGNYHDLYFYAINPSDTAGQDVNFAIKSGFKCD